MNSLSHFSFYLHLSVIAIKLSLQTFILPQIKSWNIIGLKLSVSNHIISCWLLTWIQLIFPLRTHPHDCWPNIKSINTHVSISHKIKVLTEVDFIIIHFIEIDISEKLYPRNIELWCRNTYGYKKYHNCLYRLKGDYFQGNYKNR